ncbi:unnamed protein product [Amoebophrya sp. A120]|nr:unnamed protein product [Amoebophrya sp. A120]|eukprot:GSA120T00005260001.1
MSTGTVSFRRAALLLCRLLYGGVIGFPVPGPVSLELAQRSSSASSKQATRNRPPTDSLLSDRKQKKREQTIFYGNGLGLLYDDLDERPREVIHSELLQLKAKADDEKEPEEGEQEPENNGAEKDEKKDEQEAEEGTEQAGDKQTDADKDNESSDVLGVAMKDVAESASKEENAKEDAGGNPFLGGVASVAGGLQSAGSGVLGAAGQVSGAVGAAASAAGNATRTGAKQASDAANKSPMGDAVLHAVQEGPESNEEKRQRILGVLGDLHGDVGLEGTSSFRIANACLLCALPREEGHGHHGEHGHKHGHGHKHKHAGKHHANASSRRETEDAKTTAEGIAADLQGEDVLGSTDVSGSSDEDVLGAAATTSFLASFFEKRVRLAAKLETKGRAKKCARSMYEVVSDPKSSKGTNVKHLLKDLTMVILHGKDVDDDKETPQEREKLKPVKALLTKVKHHLDDPEAKQNEPVESVHSKTKEAEEAEKSEPPPALEEFYHPVGDLCTWWEKHLEAKVDPTPKDIAARATRNMVSGAVESLGLGHQAGGQAGDAAADFLGASLDKLNNRNVLTSTTPAPFLACFQGLCW